MPVEAAGWPSIMRMVLALCTQGVIFVNVCEGSRRACIMLDLESGSVDSVKFKSGIR